MRRPLRRRRDMSLSRELRRAIERAANEAGALVEFQRTGNLSHTKVTLTGRQACTHVSGTPGDPVAYHKILADVHHTLRDLGYVKPPKVKKVEKPWRPRVVARGEPAPASASRYRPRYRDEKNAMVPVLRELKRKLAS